MCRWAAVLKDLKEQLFCREGEEESFEVSKREMCKAVKHFTFLEAESEHFYLSWEWVRGGGGGGSEVMVKSDENWLSCDTPETGKEG